MAAKASRLVFRVWSWTSAPKLKAKRLTQYVGMSKEDTRRLYKDGMRYNGFSERFSGKMLSHNTDI